MIGKRVLVLKGSVFVGDTGMHGTVVAISQFGGMLLVEFPQIPKGKEAYYHDGVGSPTVNNFHPKSKNSRWYWPQEVAAED